MQRLSENGQLFDGISKSYPSFLSSENSAWLHHIYVPSAFIMIEIKKANIFVIYT